MKKSLIFLAPGFEEMEASNPLDILRRGGVDVSTVSITDSRLVEGAHGVRYEADMLLSEVDPDGCYDFLIMPGGLPGATNLRDCKALHSLVMNHAAKGGNLAAICASPAFVFYAYGLLDGKDFTGYPGTEGGTDKARYTGDGVTVDGNIITAKGPAFAIAFGLAILEAIQGSQTVQDVADGTLYTELTNCR